MSVKQKLVKGFAWESITKLLIQVVSWAATIYVARLLNPEDYGVMAIALVITHILNYILEMGMADGLIQRKEITQDQIDGVFYFSILLSSLLGACAYLFAPNLAAFYEAPVLEEVFEIMALAIWITGTIVMPRALVLRELDFRYRALVDVWAYMVSIVVVVVLATLDFGIWSLVYSYLTLQTCISIGYLRKLTFLPKFRLWYSGLWDIFVFGHKLMLSRLLTMVQTKSDIFIAGSFLKSEVLGYYSMAITFASVPAAKIGVIFNSLAFPTIARVADDPIVVKKYYLEMQKYLMMICMPILIGLALVAEEFVIVLLTEKWLPVVTILQLLCVANIFIVMGMLVPQILAGMGRAGLVLKYNVFVAILLPLAVLLGVTFGVHAMCWFIGFAYLISYIVVQYIISNLLGISIKELMALYKHIVVASVVLILSVLIAKSYFYDIPHLYLLFLEIIVGAGAYVLTYCIFFRGEVTKFISNFKEMKAT